MILIKFKEKNMRYFLAGIILLNSIFSFSQNALFIPDTISGTSFSLQLQQGSTNFYSGITTSTMGVNGNLLGPTLFMNQHDFVSIQVENQIGDTTTIHWHGMHVSPSNDGGPHTVILPGQTWNPQFTVLDKASTYWYHPHLHMRTNEHVQKGIAGLIIVRDQEEAALLLPRKYGIDDFPMVIQTKAFDVNGEIVTTQTALDTSLMINGTVDPYLDVPAQVVRFRVLNGSSERVYYLGLSNNQSFYQIGSDGGLLSSPVALSRLQLAPGERAEILIDFSALNGQNISLISYGAELPNAIYGAAQPGMGGGQVIPNYTSNPLNGSNFSLIEYHVGSPTSNPISTIPTSLVTHSPWQEANAQATRSLTFTPVTMGPGAINGPFLINNMAFDMMMINYYIPFENIEVWSLTNQSPIAHPFHIHDVQFYILDINGVPPSPSLQGRKDVVLVPAGNTTVRFITRFEDHFNDTLPYMYHCHMLTHEDMGMMGQFIVNGPTAIQENEKPAATIIYQSSLSSILIETPSILNNEILEIFDVSGKKISQHFYSGNRLQVDVSSFSDGIYFIHFKSDVYKNEKFIKW